MSADGSVDILWGDGEHRFRLAIGQLRELQEKCGAGPMAIFNRLRDGTWRVEDLSETLRLGLIGGGMKPVDAKLAVVRYCEGRPLLESVAPAQTVLMAALLGVPEDPVGKPTAEETTTEATDASSSPISTVPVQSSASLQPLSTA
jgi:hypothetical protein